MMADIDLCTLSDVRSHQQRTDSANTSQDGIIEALITTASEIIVDYCQREFKPQSGTAGTPIARLYRYDGNGMLQLGQDDARTITQVRVDTDTDNPITLDSDEYKLWPTRRRNGVITALHLIGVSVPQRTVQNYPVYREVEVTGTWGWPEVPEKVRRACVLLTLELLQRTSTWRSVDDELVPSAVRVATIPGYIRGLLASYRRRSVGG